MQLLAQAYQKARPIRLSLLHNSLLHRLAFKALFEGLGFDIAYHGHTSEIRQSGSCDVVVLEAGPLLDQLVEQTRLPLLLFLDPAAEYPRLPCRTNLRCLEYNSPIELVRDTLYSLAPHCQPKPTDHRQVGVLTGLIKGHTNSEIAKDLGMSVSLVKLVLRELFQDWGAQDRAQLAAMAVTRGYARGS